MLTFGGLYRALLLGTCVLVLVFSADRVVGEAPQLVWSDEFDGDRLDLGKWSHRYPGKRKLGYSTSDSVSVSNGTLKIAAYKRDGRYWAGMIGTQGKFEARFGYFEIRARMPKATGLQAAFWLQSPSYGAEIGNPEGSGTEIDVVEYIKIRPGELHFTNHWDGYGSARKSSTKSVRYPKIEDGDWHTFGLRWASGSYEFFVDGVRMHEMRTAISQVSEYIVLSLEVSQWAGGGEMVDGDLPDQLEVDYVRVYQDEGGSRQIGGGVSP